MNSPIRAVLFDIGNVLLRFDFTVALRALASKSSVPDPVAVLSAIESVKMAYEDGQIDRAAFLREAFLILDYTGSEAEFVAIWEEIFEPNAPMIALVEKLAKTYPLFLLSNTSDIHRDYIFRAYPFFQHFKAGVYSYEVKASKPGPEIYAIACRALGLQPESTFFIDDLLANIETARRCGFVCHHYHHERHQSLLEDLAKRGVC